MNSLDQLTVSGNLVDKISDHLPNFVFFGNQLNKDNIKSNSMHRDYRMFDKDICMKLSKWIFA